MHLGALHVKSNLRFLSRFITPSRFMTELIDDKEGVVIFLCFPEMMTTFLENHLH